MPLLLILALAPWPSPSHASLLERFHQLTCDKFLDRTPTAGDMARLKAWLDAEMPPAGENSYQIKYSEIREDSYHERKYRRESRILKKQLYAALDRAQNFFPDLIRRGLDWTVSVQAEDWIVEPQGIRVIPFLDRVTWDKTGTEPTGAEFMVMVIEYCRYSGQAPYMIGKCEDPLVSLVFKAEWQLPQLDRASLIRSDEDHHGMRVSFVRLESSAPIGTRLRQLLEFERRLRAAIAKYPTNSKVRALFDED